jgi:tetratricopeptide (TPR) repeat protein
MSSLRLLAAVCLTVSTALPQFSENCLSPTDSKIPPASVGTICDPRQTRYATLEPTERVVAPRPRTASVSVHQLTHEVPKKARNAYLDAEHAKSAGHLDAAIRHYQRALKFDPAYLEAWNNLASAHILSGDLATAEADLAQAYKLDPTAYPVLTNLAFVHLRTNRPASAESFARRAVQADPLSTKGLYLLGISLAGQNKDKPEAIRLLEKSCDTYGRAHFSIAPLLAEADRLPEAAQHLRAYLALNLPTNRDVAREWLKNVEDELARRLQ